jgi:drug/metabolite transporter (DMT)-like permease
MSAQAAARLQVAATALLFSVGGAGIKACEMTSWQIAGFRSGVAALTILFLLPACRRGWTWRAVVVGTSYAATMVLFVLANKLTTSANTIFLQSTAPLYVLLLGPWLLGERNRISDLVVLVMVAGGLSLFFVGSEAPVRTAPAPFQGNLLAVASGLTWALTIMGMRWLGREEHAGRGSAAPAVVLGNLIALLVSLPFALPVVHARPIDVAIVIGLGTVQIGVAYICLTRALRQVPAFEAMILLLLEPALNPIWAWLVHGERPGAWPILGGALILGATGLKTWADSRAGRGIEPLGP